MRCARFLLTVSAVFLCVVSLAQRKPAGGGELPFVSGKRWAIVVGASKYTHYSQLDYADDDAIAFAKALTEDFSFNADNVRLLTDGSTAAQAPTAGNILGEVEDILASKTLDKSDLFVFFFSGHGVGTDAGDFLLPTDARTSTVERVGLPVAEVIKRFSGAGLANVLIIVDACRSGKTNPFGAELQELGKKANLAVMLGCAPGARSYEEKSLGHGLFAYSLLGALKDPSLRDSRSGSLWASKVAASVRSRVYAYSERDHPDEPQTPSVWSDGSEDVLLGAYMPEGSSALEAFRHEAERLAPEAHAAALSTYADTLMEADRYDDAIEILKTLEGLGRLGPASRYLLGAALFLADRNGESAEVLAELIKSDAPDYFRNLAVVTTGALNGSPQQKVDAAKGLWEEVTDEETAAIVWTIMRNFARKSDQVSFLESAKNSALSKRMRAAIQGDLAYLKADYKAAVEHFSDALAEPGNTPNTQVVAIAKLNALLLMGASAEVERYIDERIAKGEDKAYWLTNKAQRLKDSGKIDEAMRVLREALKSNPNSYQLVAIANIGGRHKDQIASELKEAAQKHKFSWRAKLAEAFAEFPTDPNFAATLDAAERLADDPVAFSAISIDLFESFMRENFDAGLLPKTAYLEYLESVFAVLLADIEKFGERSEAWWEIALVAANLERDDQVANLAKRILAPQIAAGSLTSACALPVMISLVNSGDFATAEKIHKAVLANGLVGGDVSRIWCIALATAGRFEEANKLLDTVAPYPNAESDIALLTLRAWLAAETKNKAEAERILDSLNVVEAYAKQMAGLAYAALDNWEKAMPLLSESLTERSWGYLTVSAVAMKKYDSKIREEGNLEKLRQTAFNAGLSRPGNPMFQEFHFLEKADLSAYDGEIQFDIVGFSDLGSPFSGTLKLTIKAGAVTGIMDTSDNVSVIDAKIDQFGNARGTVRSGGKSLNLIAKLAPPELYESFEPFSETGQVLFMYDDNYRRTAWIGKPKKKDASTKRGGIDGFIRKPETRSTR